MCAGGKVKESEAGSAGGGVEEKWSGGKAKQENWE